MKWCTCNHTCGCEYVHVFNAFPKNIIFLSVYGGWYWEHTDFDVYWLIILWQWKSLNTVLRFTVLYKVPMKFPMRIHPYLTFFLIKTLSWKANWRKRTQTFSIDNDKSADKYSNNNSGNLRRLSGENSISKYTRYEALSKLRNTTTFKFTSGSFTY